MATLCPPSLPFLPFDTWNFVFPVPALRVLKILFGICALGLLRWRF
jgi:hypothetical protein